VWLEICVLVLIYSLLYSPLLYPTSLTLPTTIIHHTIIILYHHHPPPPPPTTNHKPPSPFTHLPSPTPITCRRSPHGHRQYPHAITPPSLPPRCYIDRVNEPNNPSMAAATLQLEEGGGNSGGGGGGGYFWYAAVLAHGCIPLSARRTFLILLILLIPSIRQCCSRTPSPGITCMVSCIVYHVSCIMFPSPKPPKPYPIPPREQHFRLPFSATSPPRHLSVAQGQYHVTRTAPTSGLRRRGRRVR